MGTRRLLDAHGGVVTSIETDELTGESIIGVHQDVEPTILHNRDRQRDGTNGYGKSRMLRHVASIPYGIIHQWCGLAGITFGTFWRWNKYEQMAFIRRYANDIDYQDVRTVSGKV